MNKVERLLTRKFLAPDKALLTARERDRRGRCMLRHPDERIDYGNKEMRFVYSLKRVVSLREVGEGSWRRNLAKQMGEGER